MKSFALEAQRFCYQRYETHLGLHKTCPIFLSDFSRISCFATDFRKNAQQQSLRQSVQWKPRWYMRTDGRTADLTWRSQLALFATGRARLKAIISLHRINRSVFIFKAERVYCAVRTESVNYSMLYFIFKRLIPCDLLLRFLFCTQLYLLTCSYTELILKQLILQPSDRTSITRINLPQHLCLPRSVKHSTRLEM